MTKLVITILGTSYFLGLFWYIVCDLKEIIQAEPLNFLAENFKETDGSYRRTVASMYYAFTSLSTVGFGDFHPINNFERMFCAGILLVGNAIFGYVLGLFRDMVQEIRGPDGIFGDDDNDDVDGLNRFFSLIQKFNEGRMISKSL